MKSGLIVFDIDGTLTDTNGVDGLCFSKAMSNVFGIHEITTDWADYEHTTDSGILRQLLREELGQDATAEMFKNFKTTFVAELERARVEKPSHFSEVPGASKIFDEILRSTNWGVSIATGAWEPSARFKLTACKVSTEYPMGFAEDHIDRREIIKTSIDRAKNFYDQKSFETLVYIGDGIWDLNAAKSLGMGFIGVDVSGLDQRLKPQGAHTIRDYLNPDSFIKSIQKFSRSIYSASI